jgi:acyl transferase domain-containing protein/NAD(P)-dependent dehydrogenase (short-subunit alcohol dehydrogenase family)/acyl carrier protein
MLEVINVYLHGYVAVPLLSVSRELGIFSALEKAPVNVRQMGAALSANSGYCRIVFRGLHALSCVESTDHETYTLSDRFRHALRFPEAIDDIYRIDFPGYLSDGVDAERMERWLVASAQGWDTADAELAQLLDGAIMVPLLLELAMKGVGQISELPEDLTPHIHPSVHAQLRTYLSAKGLLEHGASFSLNQRGSYLCERALTMASTASYRPMLMGLRELVCGDPTHVLGRDADGHETHVDRTLNVVGSGFQHDKYFQDLAELVIGIFDREPVSEQPHYIIDMGCGDGTLLKMLHASIVECSLRGRHLAEYPLLLIGADFNEKSLQAAERTLAELPHLLLRGDIARPQTFLDDLKVHGVTDVDAMLHVRSFLDHDRPIDLRPSDEDALPSDDYVYVNAAGQWLHSSLVARDLREHLARWSSILGRHGMILLEVFALPIRLTREYFKQIENFSFDLYHALSKQAVVGAGTFHQALASAGLYPDQESLVRYPKTMPFSRIVLQHVRPKPFSVRPLRLDDMPDLLAIDSACWPENLRLSAEEIERRHCNFADGQFVIEYKQRVVGVLYMQCIDDLDRVLALRREDYPSAHVATGRYWQLLGISAHPDYQSLAPGDQLLEHVLDLAALTAGVVAVYGVTRCLAFGTQSEPMADYIHRKGAQGLPIDPLLRFHYSHGAAIEQVVLGAWPEDTDNGGDGVLIRYDLAARLRGPRAGRDEAVPQERHGALESVAQAIRRLMKTPEEFVADRPLKELGLDSMDLMELRLLLNQAFAVEFEPAFFFSYPTAKAIAGYVVGPGERESGTPQLGTSWAVPQQAAAPDRPAGSVGQAAADIAIVGLALRFAGDIDTPESYWQLLVEQGCVITPRPEHRWREYREELTTLDPQWRHIHQGGFLKDIEQFDAAFFHITPLEAQALDPQQRLLLELVWEALEQAGIDPHGLAGHPVGMFLGAYTHDYEALTLRQRAIGDVDAYFGVGNALSAAAGRLAYFFDFRGPTMTVDTACSSSSSAVFVACQSLADGGTELAVAASVNMMIGPALSVAFAKAGMLSPDGLCKTFDNTADGYVRAEGGAVLLLKRLDDALRDGDHVHAVIKSVASMQDGRTNGLTAPNGQAQVDVIRRALALANRTAADVSYVEAHGTGTYLGDPVEMQALRDAYCGGGTRASALCVGSVKTNLGHTEAVSGMAGIIKVVLAMRHRMIPAHLHVKQVSELLKLEDGSIEIPLQARSWEMTQGRPRLAGVSSFGFSGSNTHILIEEFAPPPVEATVVTGMLPAVISAKSPLSLRKNIAALSQYVDRHGDQLDLAALSRTLTRGRAQHACRVAFVLGTLDELRKQLDEAVRDDARLSSGQGQGARIAFMFTGQGSQYHGMAHRLVQSSAIFRGHLGHCATLIRRYAGFNLFDVLWGDDRTLIDQTRYTQVALFCIEYSLAELLREAGIEAKVVLGHSVGEFAAACYAGVMSVESTIRLLCHRGELMQEQTRHGSMVALLAPLAEVEKLLRGFDQVAVAAMNGPKNQVIAGDPQQIGDIVKRAGELGILAFPLPVERAFHSPLMTPILPLFRQLADELDYAAPRVALISNVTGDVCTKPLTGQYWTDHIRVPVRFEQSVRSLLSYGVDWVVEIGPKPILTKMAMTAAPDPTVRWLPSLFDASSHGLAAIYAQASQAGLEIDWRSYPHPSASVLADLPHYQFERAPYWITPAASPAPFSPRVSEEASRTLELARFQQRVDLRDDGALWAHMLGRESVFPAGAHVALALEAGLRLLKRPAGIVLRGLRLNRMLRLEPDVAYRVELTALPSPTTAVTLQLRTQQESSGEWTSCGQVTVEPLNEHASPIVVDMPPAAGALVMHGDDFYPRLAALGYAYQPPFQGIRTIRRAGDDFIVELSFPDSTPSAGYAATPWSLDGCFQTVLIAALDSLEANAERLLLPVAIERLVWHAPLSAQLRVSCHFRTTDTGIDAELRIFDQHGRLCCEVDGLRTTWVQRRSLGLDVADVVVSPIYIPTWRLRAEQATLPAAPGSWLILGDESGQSKALAESIIESGGRVALIRLAELPADASGEAVLSGMLERHAGASDGPFGLIHAWSIDLDAHSIDAPRRRALDLAVLRFLAALPAIRLHRAIMLTRLAQPVLPTDVLAIENGASLWGLASALQSEIPGHAVTLIDVEAVRTEAERRLQATQILLTPAEESYADTSGWPEHFALRGGQRYVRELAPAKAEEAPVRIVGDGCYLISGGLGGVGRLAVEFLHAKGAGRLVLLSRHLPAVAPAWVQALNVRRNCVELVACDVADRTRVAEVTRTIAQAGPIRGIVHAAGVVDDALFADQNAQRLHAVHVPKVDGARNLFDSVPAERLDFAWLFSSVVGLFGGAGQANYAAANAALDGYAHWLRGQGVRATSINWGPWRDTGMLARLAQPEAIRDRLHLDMLDPADSTALFSALLAISNAQCCVASWRLDLIAQAEQLPVLLRPLRGAQTKMPPPSYPRLSQLLEDALGEERLHRTRRFVAERIAHITGLSIEAIHPLKPLTELGIDSLISTKLIFTLSKSLDKPLAATLLFDHPTLDALAAHLLAQSGLLPAGAEVEATVVVSVDGQLEEVDTELAEIEGLQDEDLAALLGTEFIRE